MKILTFRPGKNCSWMAFNAEDVYRVAKHNNDHTKLPGNNIYGMNLVNDSVTPLIEILDTDRKEEYNNIVYFIDGEDVLGLMVYEIGHFHDIDDKELTSRLDLPDVDQDCVDFTYFSDKGVLPIINPRELRHRKTIKKTQNNRCL